MGRPRSDGDLLAAPRRGAIVAGVMLAAAGLLAVLVGIDTSDPPLLGAGDRVWRDLIQPPAVILETLSRWLYVLGSGAVMVPLRIAVALWLAARRRYVDLWAWLLGWLAADVLTQILKPGLGRLRPDLGDASSFPSGHAKSAAQVAVGLVLLLPFDRRRGAWVGASIWIAAVALSRTIVDDHWASDVIAGSLIGAGCAVGAAALCQMWRDRRAVQARRPLAAEAD